MRCSVPAVSNVSPIFNLACINRLPLLPEQFGAVWIPKAADDEPGDWVQDWVQVAPLETGSRLVSCAGSTKRLTAANQEVAGSSPAGRVARIPNTAAHEQEIRRVTDEAIGLTEEAARAAQARCEAGGNRSPRCQRRPRRTTSGPSRFKYRRRCVSSLRKTALLSLITLSQVCIPA